MAKYLTKEGLEKLKNELEHLEKVERKEVIKRISHAASHGDLKENAGYHAAREDQGFIEGRIADLKKIIDQAKVIEGGEKDKVQAGSIVFLESKDGKDKYQIVEPEEADILTGKISLRSPLGEALLGKKKGDVVKFNASGGAKEYKIINLE
ncbi:MAG: transcription elongation factor GreA [Candidatus Nealsonbacteria bacterium]|nr:transcription elongation factor GreA [Candidatus Nealsonbacteria bacterium]